eukprot:COSAG01_NODE_17912_length_1114_cov_84.765517_2_plen_84_part_00
MLQARAANSITPVGEQLRRFKLHVAEWDESHKQGNVYLQGFATAASACRAAGASDGAGLLSANTTADAWRRGALSAYLHTQRG